MKKLLWLVMMIPIVSNAQDKGVHFEQGLGWEQVKAKAKAEHKYIFVDCFATWCGPCKLMDKEVYTDKQVGLIINERFVAVKMQMDSTKNDNEDVRKWYGQVNEFKTKLSINAFPTYLFFSPDGIIVHRDEGFKDVDDFMVIVKKSLDTTKQYYTLLQNYRMGRHDFATMPYLAIKTKDLKDRTLADKIASDYLYNYLFRLSVDTLLNKKTIEFIYSFDHLISSGDNGFKLFFSRGRFVDSIMHNKTLSNFVVDYIVMKEEIDPVLKNAYKKHVTPDWKMLLKKIKMKFSEACANRVLLKAKVNYYETVKNWDEYLRYAILRIQTNSKVLSDVGFQIETNIVAWKVFEHSNDKRQLNEALRWMQSLDTSSQAGWMDTRANLLYKLDRKKEAILVEARAAALAPQDQDIKNNFEKMKNNKKISQNGN